MQLAVFDLTNNNWLSNDGRYSDYYAEIPRVNVERIVSYTLDPDCIFYLGSPVDKPQERHLYTTNSNFTTLPRCLTCLPWKIDNTHEYNYFDATFNTRGQGQYLVLHAQGPSAPFSRLFEWGQSPNAKEDGCHIYKLQTLRSNQPLLGRIAERTAYLRDVRYMPLRDGGHVRLLWPEYAEPRYDVDYPLLVQPYGGPETAIASDAFRLEWADFMATNLSVVVAQIDLRNTVRYDTDCNHHNALTDGLAILHAIREVLQQNPLIDPHRIGIWGEGFAGLVAGMAIFFPFPQAPQPFRCAALVAPLELEWHNHYDPDIHNVTVTDEYENVFDEDRYIAKCENSNLAVCITDMKRPPNVKMLLVNDGENGELTEQTRLLHEVEKALAHKSMKYEWMDVIGFANETCGVWEAREYYAKLTNFFAECLAE